MTLVKTSALDAECKSVISASPPVDLGPDADFTQTSNAGKPGDCIIWQLVLSNRGADDAKTIVINDMVPTYTKLVQGSTRICLGDAGTAMTPACTFAATGAEYVTTGSSSTQTINSISTTLYAAGSTAVYNLDNWILGTWFVDKKLVANQSVTIRFATRID